MQRCPVLLFAIAVLIARSVAAQKITEFHVGVGRIGDITAGADGNLWFTETGANKIARMTVSGDVTTFVAFGPVKIAADRDGNVWFTQSTEHAIGEVRRDGEVLAFSIPEDFGSEPVSLVGGPDANIWYTTTISRVGRMTPGGSIKEFGTGYDGTSGITAGPDGNIWFTTAPPLAPDESKICSITPDGVIHQYGDYGAFASPRNIVTGPDGNLWFTLDDASVGRITTAGVYVIFPIDAPAAAITTLNDGNLWLAIDRTIVRLSTEGVVTGQFALPSNVGTLTALTRGPDGNLWFGDEAGTIGRFELERRRRAVHH